MRKTFFVAIIQVQNIFVHEKESALVPLSGGLRNDLKSDGFIRQGWSELAVL
jgi:hypothetical protein